MRRPRVDRNWASTLLLSLLVAALAAPAMAAAETGAGAQGEGMPLILMDPPLPTPYWIDARIALKPDGSLDSKLFHPAAARRVQELLSAPEQGGCVPAGIVWENHIEPQPRGSLEDAARSAPTVLVGRVVDESHGFNAGIAGTLLAIEPTERVKGATPAHRYYLVLPMGTFPLGTKTICKTDNRFADLPDLGDEVVVFTFRPAGEHGQLLPVQDPGDVVTLHAERVSLPVQFRRLPSSHRDELMTARPTLETKEQLMAFVHEIAKGAQQ